MLCEKCGAQINDGVKFCGICGTAVAASVTAIAPDAVVPESEATTFAQPVPSMEAIVPDSEATTFAQPEQGMDAIAPDSEATTFAQPAQQYAQPAQQYAQPAQQQQYAQPAQQYVPPVQQQYAPPVQPAQTVRPVKKRVPGGVVALVCVLFGILILITGLAAGIALSVRTTLANNMISDEIAQSDVFDVEIGDILLSDMLHDDIEEVMKDYGKDIKDIEEDMTVSEFIILVADDEELTEKKLKQMFKDTSVMSYLGRVAASYEEYLLYDVDGDEVSVEEIMKLVDKNLDEVEDIMRTMFLLDSDELEAELEKKEDTLDDLNPQNALDGIGETTSLILSPGIIIAAAVLALLLALIAGLICKSVSAPTMTLGICSVLVGGVMVAVSMLKSVIIDAVGLSYSLVDGFLVDILDNSIFAQLQKYGLIIAAAGVVLVIVAVIINVVSSAVRARKA